MNGGIEGMATTRKKVKNGLAKGIWWDYALAPFLGKPFKAGGCDSWLPPPRWDLLRPNYVS
jgi:hypothetical protein